jgi:hypothetical protein
MGNSKPPLNATIKTVDFTLSSSGPPTQSVAIPNYHGHELYCHASSDGTILTITINDQPANDNVAGADASIAVVTIGYGKVPPQTVTFNPINYSAGTRIGLRFKLSRDLSEGYLSVADEPSQNINDSRLAFVLVYEDSTAERYRLEWIANPIHIDHAPLRSEASVVQPNPTNGGAMGPMGLALP